MVNGSITVYRIDSFLHYKSILFLMVLLCSSGQCKAAIKETQTELRSTKLSI